MEPKNYAWPVTVAGRYDYDALEKCVNQYKDILDKKQLVIFGAGIRGTVFSIWLKKKGYTQIIFTDNNPEKVGNYINEFYIEDFKEVCKNKKDLFLLVSVENSNAIYKQLIESGFKEGTEFVIVRNNVYEEFVHEFLEEKPIETMILGDCGLTDVGMNDNDYKSLGKLLKEELGEERTKVLAMHGMGMRAYYQLVKAYCRVMEKPKQILVMANFETFTGKQHLLPRSQHTQLFEMLCQQVKDKELEDYLQITRERSNNWQLDYFTSANSAAEKHKSNDKMVIRMNYMYQLQMDNECVQYMLLLHKFCKEQNIKLLFFIPPVNYQYAEKLWGEKFRSRYSENVRKLKMVLEEEQIEILDMSYLLLSSEFAAECTIDECTNYKGRIKEKEELLNFLKQ